MARVLDNGDVQLLRPLGAASIHASPSGAFTAMLMLDGTVRVRNFRLTSSVPCCDAAVTDGGVVAILSTQSARFLQISQRDGEMPNALIDLRLPVAGNEDMNLASFHGVEACGGAAAAAEGSAQCFALRVHHMPLGNDPIILATFSTDRDSYRIIELPLPFASVDMIPSGPEFRLYENNIVEAEFDQFVPSDVRIALTATRVLTAGFVRRAPAELRVSELRCYDTATGELVWHRTLDGHVVGHVAAHGNTFYASAVTHCTRPVMENRTGASLLQLDDAGGIVRAWPDVMQPNMPFFISPNGLYAACLYNDGTASNAIYLG